MKTKSTNGLMQNHAVRIVVGTLLILSIPFFGKWPWDETDFIIIGALLLGTGFTYEVVSRNLKDSSHRILFGIALFITLVLIWAELAVGLFGTPFAGS